MYLHLGQSFVVPSHAVVGIFDMDNATAGHRTRKTLNRAEREGRVHNIAEDIPRSFVVCHDAVGGEVIYLSQLSSATLMRRAEQSIVE